MTDIRHRLNLKKLADSLDEVPTLGGVLDQTRHKPEDYSPKREKKETSQKWDKSWLVHMAEALLDARFGEMVNFAEGVISFLPKESPVDGDSMAKAIHQWATKQKEEYDERT